MTISAIRTSFIIRHQNLNYSMQSSIVACEARHLEARRRIEPFVESAGGNSALSGEKPFSQAKKSEKTASFLNLRSPQPKGMGACKCVAD
jgi:hypothetical protein